MNTSEVGQRWAVVPARFDSSRLPGKVLSDIGGRTMLEHVWRRVLAADCFHRVVVATDDDRIDQTARAFGAQVVRTGPAPCGTARAAIAVGNAAVDVVCVQADQPLLDPLHLRIVVDLLSSGPPVATLSAPFPVGVVDPALVRVVVDDRGRATRFSRSPCTPDDRLHVGLYGFTAGQLARCAAAPITARATEEDLEQISWLDAGIRIVVGEVDRSGPSVDTQAQLDRVRGIVSAA